MGSGNPKIWTPAIRLIHWGLACSVLVSWLTPHGPSWLHDGAGCAVLALAFSRFLIGCAGRRQDRFGSFVASPATTLAYARRVLSGSEPRYLGHNPLGGWMIVALLGTGFVAGVSGWLYTTDRFWGLAWMEAIHGTAADLLILLACVHVAGVVFTSVRQGENLVASMIHGRKPRATARHPESPVEP